MRGTKAKQIRKAVKLNGKDPKDRQYDTAGFHSTEYTTLQGEKRKGMITESIMLAAMCGRKIYKLAKSMAKEQA